MIRHVLAAVSAFIIIGVSAPSRLAGAEKTAAIPDLTKGEGPSIREAAKDDWPLDFAPGYSRIKGWIYPGLKIGIKGTRDWSRDQRVRASEKSRQILITRVPADSKIRRQLKVGDVILGVDGKPFSKHAVHQFRDTVRSRLQPEGKMSVITWRKDWKASRTVTLHLVDDIVDFTKGDAPDQSVDWNLGATGARGWVYGKNDETFLARQILVTKVHNGSPAEGILQKGDVILGVEGKRFESDARKTFGKALTRAETRRGEGRLRLLRWREDETSEAVIQIPVMGSYSKTTPWKCDKSQKILDNACAYLVKRGLADDTDQKMRTGTGQKMYGYVNALALMATGDEQYMPIVREHVHKIAREAGTDAYWLSRLRINHGGLVTWFWSYSNLLLTEYYLQTKDETVLPAIEKYSNALALGQSGAGSWGHDMAPPVCNDGKPHGPCVGYGAMNQCSTISWISLLLAKRCGVTNPEIEQAIQRGYDYTAFYVDKFSIPYGDMVLLGLRGHDDNGKNSAAACGFSLFGDKAGTEFFSRMTVASYDVREKGHTGNYFSFLWGPLGAARSGQKGCSAFLHELSWVLDLERRWDGGFTYQGKPGTGYGYDERRGRQRSGAEHQYPGWDTTGARILMYCLPRKILYITGKDGYTAKLSSRQVADTIEAGRALGSITAFSTKYDNHSVGQLLDLLGSWSPEVRQCAAMSLARKPGDHTAKLTKLLCGRDRYACYGACMAFQQLGPKAAAGVDELLKQLHSKDQLLQIRAMLALGAIGDKRAVPELLKMAASEFPEDRKGMLHRYLAHALFNDARYDKYTGLLADSIDGVDRELLVPAAIRLLRSHDGQARAFVTRTVLKKLTLEEMQPLWPATVRALKTQSISFVMRAHESREGIVEILAENRIEEGIDLLVYYLGHQKWHGTDQRAARLMGMLMKYGVSAKQAIPGLETHLRNLAEIEKVKDIRYWDAKNQQPVIRKAIEDIKQLKEKPNLISIKEYW